MNATETKTISARVPVQVAREFAGELARLGLNSYEVITELLIRWNTGQLDQIKSYLVKRKKRM